MITVRLIEDKDAITRITLEVMTSLPEWFSPIEDIQKKSITHRDYPFFVAYCGDREVGFLALKLHNRFTADIYVIGVLREYHHSGAGSMLVAEAERWCRSNGFVYLTVKTLDESADYAPYDQTRAFYRRVGFIPLEVFTTFWDEENPCLFLAKYLGEAEK